MANVIEVVARYKDEVSKGLVTTRGNLEGFVQEVKRLAAESSKFSGRSGEVVKWGEAWGTAGGKITAASKATAAAANTSTAAIQGLARSGLAELGQQIPGVNQALGGLVGKLGGLPLLLGGVVGAGVALLGFLREWQVESTKTLAVVTTTSEGIAAAFQTTRDKVAQIDADSRGDRAAAAQASLSITLRSIEQERAEKVRAAQAELDAVLPFSLRRAEAEAEFAAKRAKAESDAANAAVVAAAERNAKLRQFDKERAEMSQALARDLAAAQAETTAAFQKAQGDELGALQTNTDQKKALLQQALADQLKTLQELDQGSQAGQARRLDAEQAYQEKVKKLELDTAEERKAILAKLTDDAIRIFETLGPGFEKAIAPLREAQFVAKLTDDLKKLKTLHDAGKISASDYARATEAINAAIAKGPPAIQQEILSLDQLTQTIIANKTALAALDDANVRQVLDGELATRSFSDMGAEIDALTQEYVTATQELTLFEVKTAQLGSTQATAATQVNVLRQEIEASEAATARMNAQFKEAAFDAVTLTGSFRDFQTTVAGLTKELSQVGRGASFSFVQDPKLRQEIEKLRQDIVQSSGQQRIENVKKLDQLLETNKDILDADRAARQIQDERRALDEKRNQLLEAIRAATQKFQQDFFAFAANQAQRQQQQMDVPIFQRGGLVPGEAGRPVPILAHAGDLVIPADVVRGLSRHRGQGGRFQRGGIVTPQGATGLGLSVVFHGPVHMRSDEDIRHLAREITRQQSDARRRRAGLN